MKNRNFGGDPSPLTAQGIFCGIRSAVAYKLEQQDLNGITVAVQGAGAVGRYLIKLLHEAGARTVVCDINEKNLAKARDLGSRVVDVHDIVGVDAEVFAPCAMGAILNDDSIPQLKASIVAGGANNQLAESRHAQMLRDRSILYAPDFVINAGGIIEICRQYKNLPMDECLRQIETIGATLTDIFSHSDASGLTTSEVAEKISEQKFNAGGSVTDAA